MEKVQVLVEAPFTRGECQKTLLYFQNVVLTMVSNKAVLRCIGRKSV